MRMYEVSKMFEIRLEDNAGNIITQGLLMDSCSVIGIIVT